MHQHRLSCRHTEIFTENTFNFFCLVIFACEASMRIITFLCDTETHPVQLAMPTRIAETRNTTNGDRFSILCIQYFSQLFQYLFHFTLLRQDNINIRTWNLEYALKRRASHIYSSIERVENTQIQSQLVTTKNTRYWGQPIAAHICAQQTTSRARTHARKLCLHDWWLVWTHSCLATDCSVYIQLLAISRHVYDLCLNLGCVEYKMKFVERMPDYHSSRNHMRDMLNSYALTSAFSISAINKPKIKIPVHAQTRFLRKQNFICSIGHIQTKCYFVSEMAGIERWNAITIELRWFFTRLLIRNINY